MWVIALEALVALGLLLLIVWLTMGQSRNRDDAEPPKKLEDQSERDESR